MAIALNAGFWLLPSRRRPHNLQRFFKALDDTDTCSQGLVFVQENDYASMRDAYDALSLHAGWRFVLTQGDSQGDKLREQASLYADADWVGLIGDDQQPVTPYWDAKLVGALNGWNLVTCMDDWVFNTPTKFNQPNRMAGVLLFSGALHRALGYIFPPPMHHVYLDDIYEELATKIEFWTICRDVMILHHHVGRNLALADDTDRIAYAGTGSYAGLDFYPWEHWRKHEMGLAVDRIRNLKVSMGVAP